MAGHPRRSLLIARLRGDLGDERSRERAAGHPRRTPPGHPGRRCAAGNGDPGGRGRRAVRRQPDTGAGIAQDADRRGSGRASAPVRLHRCPADPRASCARSTCCEVFSSRQRWDPRWPPPMPTMMCSSAGRTGPVHGAERIGPPGLSPGEPPVSPGAARPGEDPAVVADAGIGLESDRTGAADGPHPGRCPVCLACRARRHGGAFLARDAARLLAVAADHHRHLEESIAALPRDSAVFAWSDPALDGPPE